MTDMTDTRQCLPSKPITHNPLQILKPRNFRRGKPLTQNRQIVLPDSMPVVGDLKQFESAFLDENVDLCRVCIDRVFDEFLQGVGRTLDHFAGGNFVDDLQFRGDVRRRGETFLSRRLMGLMMVSRSGRGRFWPRGEDGGSMTKRVKVQEIDRPVGW